MRMSKQANPVLLFDDECGVCRHIARWVKALARDKSGKCTLTVRPIGTDPDELRSLHPDLDIWEAYATIHILMPDGSMKLGGEAVAVVLRHLPSARWFSWTFETRLFGFKPFQSILNLAYKVLTAIRPLFGCESCGRPSLWLRSIRWPFTHFAALFGAEHHEEAAPHFTSLSATARRTAARPGVPPA